jgi:hypothetical protein
MHDSNDGFFTCWAAGFTIADLISEKKGRDASISRIRSDTIPGSLVMGASITAAGPFMALSIIIWM